MIVKLLGELAQAVTKANLKHGLGDPPTYFHQLTMALPQRRTP